MFVFLDVQIGKCPAKRLIFELHADQVPRTCENFRGLCTGEYGRSGRLGKALCFRGSRIFRIDPQSIAGGDIELDNGRGGEGVFGPLGLPPESHARRHTHAGILSTFPGARGRTHSAFQITLRRQPQLDNRAVAFGQLVEGIDFLREIARVPADADGFPRVPVLVADCGELTKAAPLRLGAPAVQARRALADLMQSVGVPRDEATTSVERKPEFIVKVAASQALAPAAAAEAAAPPPAAAAASPAHEAQKTKIPGGAIERPGDLASQAADPPEPAQPPPAAQPVGCAELDLPRPTSDSQEKGTPTPAPSDAACAPDSVGSSEARVGTARRLALLRSVKAQLEAGRRANAQAAAAGSGAGGGRRELERAVATVDGKLLGQRRRPGGAAGEGAAIPAAAVPAAAGAAGAGGAASRTGADAAAGGGGVDESGGDVASDAAGVPGTSGGTGAAGAAGLRPYLHEPASLSQSRAASLAQRRANEKAAFGWDVMNAEAQYRGHARRTERLPFDAAAYARQQRALGAARAAAPDEAAALAAAAAAGPADHARAAAALEEQLRKRKTFWRHRPVYEEAERVEYVNEGNRAFNLKLERAYGKASAEIKANLERRTAL